MEYIIENINEHLNNFREAYTETAIHNHSKVLNAFKDCNVTTEAFNGSTGYGYNDFGRAKLNLLFSIIFKSEDALVSSKFASGTHTIYTVFRGLLNYGDKIVSLTGELYDTLEKAILDDNGLVKKMGREYDKIQLTDQVRINLYIIKNGDFSKYRLAIIQRSRGYSTRRSIAFIFIFNIYHSILSLFSLSISIAFGFLLNIFQSILSIFSFKISIALGFSLK